METIGPCDVYWNSHRTCWSLRQAGTVIGHADTVLVADARFIVSQAGRRRCLRERRKNVHAFVRGIVSIVDSAAALPHRVTYNPYTHETFLSDGEPIDASPLAICDVVNDRGAVFCR